MFLSTGDFEFTQEDFSYSEIAGHSYPLSITIIVPGELEVKLDVAKVLEEVNMLDSFNPVLALLPSIPSTK